MSDQLVPAPLTPPAVESQQLDAWQEPRPPMAALARSPIERPIAAFKRYKFLIVAVIALATTGGVVATRLVTPQFEVHASVMIASTSPMEDRTAPIRSAGLLHPDDWTQLLRSYTITDVVVRKLSLFVHPDDRTNPRFFDGFGLNEMYVPGKYQLSINKDQRRWVMSFEPGSVPADSGGLVDSVGRKQGFLWQVPRYAFAGTGEEKFKFTVGKPRDAASQILTRLGAGRQNESDFLILTFQDPDPGLAARVLNTWVAEFVTVAGALKKRKLVEFTSTLAGQLQAQKSTLDAAEIELSRFRVNTITQPSEGGPISAGVQETRDPVMRDYFEKSLAYDNVKQDVQVLQTVVNSLAKDSIPSDALLQIPSVERSGAAQSLRQAFADYHVAEANLALHRQGLTDEHPTVRADLAQLRRLKRETIPQLAKDLLSSLRSREADDSVRIAEAAVNLQKIPQRTIEEERLRRARDVAAGLYANLQNRFAEAQLSEASAAADVRVLDSAIAPLSPNKNTAGRLLFMAIAGGIGGALALAILLDKMDARLRYPDQATEDLSLPVVGAIPKFPKGGVDQNSPDQMFQLVESFRSLRMAVMHASSGGGVAVAVSSPAPNEGKSLISANLAMSFADAGFRTVLVDGDTRRGALHDMFALDAAPGLTDFLAGTHSVSDILRPTSSDALTVITSGTRRRRSPELLTSPQLGELVRQLRTMFDVVVFDTPPLAAGIDGYCIAGATGELLVVLRVGQTKRRMAAEKLRLFERLPVNVIGAVLNGVRLEGAYEYYGYVPGYGATDEPQGTAMVEVS